MLGRGECALVVDPPSTQGVVDVELDHVGLGEELGDGWQGVGIDFIACFVSCVFGLGLPKLIDPAERVGGGEDDSGHRVEKFLELIDQGVVKNFGKKAEEDGTCTCDDSIGGCLVQLGDSSCGAAGFLVGQGLRLQIDPAVVEEMLLSIPEKI